MSDAGLGEVLRSVGFLNGIADEDVEHIASVGELVALEAGQVIFHAGEPAEHIYLLTSGSVSLEICASGVGCRRILTVGEGDLLGWSPVLEGTRLTATARALTATQAIRIRGSQLLTLCEHNPRFGFDFMRRTALALAKRLRAARLQLLDVYGAESAGAGPLT